jgi:beta-glucosidase
LAVPVVTGIQDQGIIATAKHWVNNEIEQDRKAVSSNVDERTRFELYYPPFEAAVRAGVMSVMCAYNRINTVSACENSDTLNHLKKTMGFKGWVISDWLATYSTEPSLHAGLDVEMPEGLHYSEAVLQKLLDTGLLHESRVDDSVLRILTTMYTIGLFDSPAQGSPVANVTSDKHNALAREIAAKATVLAKNENKALPLKASDYSNKCIAVIGDESTVSGGGSGKVTPSYIITPAQGVKNALEAAGIKDATVQYINGTDVDAAAKLASQCAVAVVVVATSSSEGSDRASLSLGNGQDELVTAVAAQNPKTIVAVNCPGAVLMPWKDLVPAIVISWLPGQEAGNALADILFGTVNPSGRLPITMPNKENEIGFTPEMYPGVGTPPEATYTEGLLVGYRWYDANNVVPAFPFGHGLSYTSFEYSNLEVMQSPASSLPLIGVTIKNSGSVTGAEVVQMYLEYPAAAGEPPKQLRGFLKTAELAPGATQHVTFVVTSRDVSVWDVATHDWSVVKGAFNVYVGSSSRDIRLQGSIQV